MFYFVGADAAFASIPHCRMSCTFEPGANGERYFHKAACPLIQRACSMAGFAELSESPPNFAVFLTKLVYCFGQRISCHVCLRWHHQLRIISETDERSRQSTESVNCHEGLFIETIAVRSDNARIPFQVLSPGSFVHTVLVELPIR